MGIFGRGYYTPDEPREADLAWRMSWQADKAVPLLAGEAFCEKPPLTYWLAAVPIKLFGAASWAARVPNLFYAVITALAVALLARRAAGPLAGLAGAAAIGTFLLAYQVTIWLATDAPLLAAVSVALLGLHRGFYANDRRERLRGYAVMHAALGFGFLAKSAAAWMVPALALLALATWERRWRELFRWELYVGVLLQAAMILTWVWFVYVGADGAAHLRVFFWNNLVGRFTRVEAPGQLQYAAAHRNTPGKYLIELPIYLAPWTLLVAAALRRAWIERRAQPDARTVRFALAASVPSLLLLSVAATARNVYFAPALPGIALLLAWWASKADQQPDIWDVRALKATAALLLVGGVLLVAVMIAAGHAGLISIPSHPVLFVAALGGLLLAAWLARRAWVAAAHRLAEAEWALFLAYGALLIGPIGLLYAGADRVQDLGSIGAAIKVDAAGRPLVLFAPDETTRAMIDMYASTRVDLVPGPIDPAALTTLAALLRAAPRSFVVIRLAGADGGRLVRSLEQADMHVVHHYAVPHGRRYALLALRGPSAP
jgi:4-amino-4-deoxy-L-arabinose transferase-like glycosyltransferase